MLCFGILINVSEEMEIAVSECINFVLLCDACKVGQRYWGGAGGTQDTSLWAPRAGFKGPGWFGLCDVGAGSLVGAQNKDQRIFICFSLEIVEEGNRLGFHPC